ncbi:MAG: UDP-N-acetylmuramate dehydrogenase [Cellvibrionaceae bacterium]
MSNLNISLNRSLQGFNTLAVPAMASHYLHVTDTEQLRQTLAFVNESNMELLILGGGSNVVLPDQFPGLVIRIGIKGFALVREDDEYAWLCAGAGEVWQDLVQYCLSQHYCGLENLSLIPGTVGAAPIQNIGAYGVELDSVFVELNALERRSGRSTTFDRESCQISNRDSIFKNRLRDKYVITSVTLKLRKNPQFNLSYAPLQEALAGIPTERITPQQISETVCAIRRMKLPDPDELPNAGSFFKNPIVGREQFTRLQQQYPGMVNYPVDEQQIKVAAAWLLDSAGWRGHSDNGVGMHVNQALVLVNPGRCGAERILQYAAKIQADIWRRFGIELEREPVVVQVSGNREQGTGNR